MPNIQEPRQHSSYSSSVLSPISSMPPIALRTFSTGSSVSGVNGSQSPHSSQTVNRHSPSSTGTNSMAQQQLPPACGARQLSKLKRFLTTLQQFGMDISPEIGDHVRSLVLALVNSHLSVEEFHAKLQQATNFPLRPFVIPFLKANLPLLQRELLHCAHLAKQSPHQYLIHNERLLFETDSQSPPLSVQDLTDLSEKPKSPDSRTKEKSQTTPDASIQPVKRARTQSPVATPHALSMVAPPSYAGFHLSGSEVPCRYEDVSLLQELREINRIDREQQISSVNVDDDKHLSKTNTSNLPEVEQFSGNIDKMDVDLKHIESMLGCIVEMVDKCKKAISGLREQWQPYAGDRVSSWFNLDAMESNSPQRNNDSILEVNRRAAELVNEVKRKALLELQKAVAESESKSGRLLAAERAKMELAVMEARKQAMEELVMTLNLQQESTETCWNCGRKASETCSGCNVARYCGSFCQHKDWEHHHKVCNQTPSSVTRGRHHTTDQRTPSADPGISTTARRIEVTTAAPADDDDRLVSSESVSSSHGTNPAGNSPVDVVKSETLN